MSIGDFGVRLTHIRESRYKSVQDAVAAMNKAGFTITAGQFYELQNGQWPTRLQLVVLSDFFNLPMEFILLGIDRRNCDKLTADQQEIIDRLTKQFTKDNEKLSPNNSR